MTALYHQSAGSLSATDSVNSDSVCMQDRYFCNIKHPATILLDRTSRHWLTRNRWVPEMHLDRHLHSSRLGMSLPRC